MKTPPNRVAVLALVLLVMVAAGAWWWRADPPSKAVSAPEATPKLAGKSPGIAPAVLRDAARMDAAMARCEADMRVLRRQRWNILAAQADPESRLTHALLSATLDTGDERVSASSLLAAAAASTPDDTEIAWYRASRCRKNADCDRGQAIGRLLELEPENLDGWLMAVQHATERGEDETALQALLERAAKASYYDPRDGETFARLYQALQDIPLPRSCKVRFPAAMWGMVSKSPPGLTSEDMAIMSAMAVSAAEIKAYLPITKLCGPQATAQAPERLEACKAIIAKIAGGNSMIDQAVGIGAMVELTAGAPEGGAWRERYRNLRWLMENQSSDFRYDRDAVVRRMTEGEIPVRQEELAAQGRWPAPADWLPQDERARSLILTGRPPPESRR